jgi:hypothetical protein
MKHRESSQREICRVCQQPTLPLHQATILNKYQVQYFECPNCKFIQTESPTWLKEAYANPMNLTDTGILFRNNRMRAVTLSLAALFFNKKAKFLDYAGGYGVFTRMMRDTGLDFYWNDPFTQNVLARGFEYSSLGQKEKHIELLTSFETFEHFEFPMDEMKKILAISSNILITTGIAATPAPKPLDWWYYGLEHGQHIALYRRETLAYIAKEFGLHFYSQGNTHLFTKKKIPKLLFKLVIKFAPTLQRMAAFGLTSRHNSDMHLLNKRHHG